MENPILFENEHITLVTSKDEDLEGDHVDGYDDYNTRNTIKVEETTSKKLHLSCEYDENIT